MDEEAIARKVIGAAIEVHRHLGPGLMESSYASALAREFSLQGLSAEREHAVTASYKGEPLEDAYRLDFLVAGKVVLELGGRGLVARPQRPVAHLPALDRLSARAVD